MDMSKVVSCTVRELLGMIARDMGRDESDLCLRSNPMGNVRLWKKVFRINDFMAVRVKNYCRIGELRMAYWRAEVDIGYRSTTYLVISMTELRSGKSSDQLTPKLSPSFSTMAKNTDKNQTERAVDPQEAI